MIALVTSIIGVVLTYLSFIGGATRQARTGVIAVSTSSLLSAIACTLVASDRNDYTSAIAMLWIGVFISAALLFHLDRPLADAAGIGRFLPGDRGVVPRCTAAFAASALTAILAFHHSGSLQEVDPMLDRVVATFAPTRFDPPYVKKPAEVDDCVLGDALPTFEDDHVVRCFRPHNWQVLSRITQSEQCPHVQDLQGPEAISIETYDVKADRWCLARASAQGHLLHSTVCAAILPCTL